MESQRQGMGNVPARAITVAKLIEQLQDFEPESRVVFVCDYGDISHTQQALPVKGAEGFTEGHLEKSGYSNSGVALNEDADDSGAEVVVLSE